MNLNVNQIIDNAITWAVAQEGSPEYCLICLAFVEDALERSNNIEVFGGDYAAESAEIYEAWRNTSEPPKGAFVFYDANGVINGEVKNWGHVALCIGAGKVVHAWDKVRIENYLEIENLKGAPGWTKPVYKGWVPVERVLEGFIYRDWNKE